MKVFKSLIYGITALCILPSLAATVRIVGKEGAWYLERDGKPYLIRGAGGVSDFKRFSAAGGNSIRTWGSDRARGVLDAAWTNGVTVTVGFWLPHQDEGANYTDPARCAQMKESILADVKALKDHPGLLLWALGNEMELGLADEAGLWRFVDDVAQEIKKIDPDHPVGTVVAEVWPAKVEQMKKFAPHLEWVGINSYGGVMNVGARWQEMGGYCPYVVTEFGPPGPEELGLNDLGCPNEWTSTQKADWYEKAYRANIVKDKGKWCLGSYAFLWGTKIEGTPTWFGMLTPQGDFLAAAETLQTMWGRAKLVNHVPTIQPLKLAANKVKVGELFRVSVQAADEDGDQLTYEWEVIEENRHYGATGLGGAVPRAYPQAVREGQGTKEVTLALPEDGFYRIYAWVKDKRGGAAVAGQAIQAGSGRRPFRGAPSILPCAVYADGATQRWWPTGYMGDVGNLTVDSRCREGAYAGETALHVTYCGSDWAGLVWQNPPNDWMANPGGVDLTGATCLTFMARGKTGREVVNFQVGLSEGRFSDSGGARLANLPLTTEWKKYTIDLKGQDLKCIKTGFAFSFGGAQTQEFWIDDVIFQSK